MTDAPVHYASVSRRLLAFILDMLLLNLVSGLLMPLLFGDALQQWIEASLLQLQAGGQPPAPFSPWLMPFCLAFPAVYVSLFWALLKATPVQYLLNMQVLRHDSGRALALPQALLRFVVLYGISFLLMLLPLLGPVGAVVLYLGMRNQAQRRGLHDLVAGSVVVMQGRQGQPPTPPTDDHPDQRAF